MASLEQDTKACDIDFLERYAMMRWRCVLYYMVDASVLKSSESAAERISPDRIRVLLHTNLMKGDETDGYHTSRLSVSAA